jgi:heat shock protein HslJ
MKPKRNVRGAIAVLVVAVTAAWAATGCGRGGEPANTAARAARATDDAGGTPSAGRPAQSGDAATTGNVGQDEKPPSAADLEGAWLLEDLGGRGVVDMVRTTLEFTADGRVSGSGGCNRFTGSYTLDGDTLGVGPLASTKMMCPEAVMAQEDGFFQALGDVDQVAVSGSFLVIHFEGSEQPLKFTRMETAED